jgi:hypothetical protein
MFLGWIQASAQLDYFSGDEPTHAALVLHLEGRGEQYTGQGAGATLFSGIGGGMRQSNNPLGPSVLACCVRERLSVRR